MKTTRPAALSPARILTALASAALSVAPRIVLNAGAAGAVVTHAYALPLSFNAEDAEATISAEVIPPPRADANLPSLDGRRQLVKDSHALARILNAQPLGVRIDTDHKSEPGAKTFAGSTAAEGWLERFRVNARGGIDADVQAGTKAVERIRSKEYRYFSPALHLDLSNNVVGLSSVALVNNPNFTDLAAPTLHNQDPNMSGNSNDGSGSLTLEQREQAVKTAEAGAKKLLLNAAGQAIDQAIVAGKVLPAQRDYHLSAIEAAPGGIEKGIESFNAMFGGKDDGSASATSVLAQRVGPRGAPPSPSAAAGAYATPLGWSPPGAERLELHAKIAEHAKARGIAYRDAAIEFGTINGV